MLFAILFNDGLAPEQAVLIFLISIFVFMFSLSVHEFFHALAAVKMGDNTPKVMGRLTLNPFKHLDMMGFLSFAIVGIGWAKPVPINPLKFKKYRTGIRWVSIVGILSNIALGLLAAGLHAILLNTVGMSSVAMEYVFLILQYFMLVNSYLAMFNLLPVYPFDGFNFISSFMRGDNNFLQFAIRNAFKILLGIIFVSLIFEVFLGFDLLGWYLSVLYNYVFSPIMLIGVL